MFSDKLSTAKNHLTQNKRLQQVEEVRGGFVEEPSKDLTPVFVPW